MKKILVILPVIMLVAVGCNTTPAIYNQPEEQQVDQSNIREQEIKPDTSKWKVYKNEKLGFQISYPSTYKVVENPEAPFVGSILITNQESFNAEQDDVYGQVYIKKARTSLKAQNSAQFNTFLVSVSKVSSIDDLESYWLYEYFTASAYDSSRAYVLSDVQPRTPGDDGSVVGNTLIATTEASTSDVIDKTTTPDWIARTMQFTK